MKRSELIKIIKEEVESTLSELGMPPVMALRTGNATAAGTAASAKKAELAAKKAELAKRKAHNYKLIAALQKMPKDKVNIEIEAKDVMLRPPKIKLKDLRDELVRLSSAQRAKFAPVYPNKHPKYLRAGVIAIKNPVSPQTLAEALIIAFNNLGVHLY